MVCVEELSVALFSLYLTSTLATRAANSGRSIELHTSGVSRMIDTVALRRGMRLIVNYKVSVKDSAGFPKATKHACSVPQLNVPSTCLTSKPRQLTVTTGQRFSDHACRTARFPSDAAITTAFGPSTTRGIKHALNARIGSCNLSILLTPNIGLVQGILYKHGRRCCSRSPILANGVTTTCVGKVRDQKANAYLGRFTMGGRRAGHGGGSSHLARHPLHRLCLGYFRVTIGRSRP